MPKMPNNQFCCIWAECCRCPMMFLFVLVKLCCLLHDHSVCLDKLCVFWFHDHFPASAFLTNYLPDYVMWWKGSLGLCFPFKGFIMTVFLFFHRKRCTLWNHALLFWISKVLKHGIYIYWVFPFGCFSLLQMARSLCFLCILKYLKNTVKYMKIGLWQTLKNIYFIPEPFQVQDLSHQCSLCSLCIFLYNEDT